MGAVDSLMSGEDRIVVVEEHSFVRSSYYRHFGEDGLGTCSKAYLVGGP